MATATATDKVTNYYGERHDIYIGADSTDPVADLSTGSMAATGPICATDPVTAG